MAIKDNPEYVKTFFSLFVYQYIGLLVSNFTMVENEGLFFFGSYNNSWFAESIFLLYPTVIACFYLFHFWLLGSIIDWFINKKYNLKKHYIEFDMILPMSAVFISVIYFPEYAYQF